MVIVQKCCSVFLEAHRALCVSSHDAPLLPPDEEGPAEKFDWMHTGVSIKQILSQSAVKARQAELSRRSATSSCRREERLLIILKGLIGVHGHRLQSGHSIYSPNALTSPGKAITTRSQMQSSNGDYESINGLEAGFGVILVTAR
ncbi:hypothetical protein Baya_7010 [Bagarius yarrelli]|uniref:Uncharacterized protein n=1 Tax=Bagarius yarrelli TaxID=175774 RepID=A0A556U3I6_BAGYA|nr:hypothetical protein Baya_7010 [Bagarius yarrelli]